jgi:hypothetical protein
MIRVCVFALAAFSLVACGERGQIAEGERAYQGKPDTPAWGDGDRGAWEKQINRRTLTQNEYRRINE